MNFYSYLLAFLLSWSAFSQGETAFTEANSAYADEKYEEAIGLYNSILEEGLVSAEVYFNMGNAYFKQNDLANAIYYYEKALQYKPTDSNIKENLEIAKTQTVDKIESAPESDISSLISSITKALSLNTWAWLSVSFSIVFGMLIILYFRASTSKSKRRYFSLALVFLVLAVASLLFGRFQSQLKQNESYAIIFENQLPVRIEPNPKSEINFQLNEGTKVKLGSNFREYTEVKLSDGSKGWVKTSAFREL